MFHSTHRFTGAARAHRRYRRVAWGVALVAVGLAWLLKGADGFSARELWLLLPATLAWSGVVKIAVERHAAAVIDGLLRIAIAAYLYVVFEHVQGWTFTGTWPVVVMAVGVAAVARGLVGASSSAGDRSW